MFTKFLKIFSCKRTTVDEGKLWLENYFIEVGKPARLKTDSTTYLKKNIILFAKIIINCNTIRHRHSNLSERYLQETLYIYFYSVDYKNWDDKLKKIEYFINSIPNTIVE